MARFEHIIAGRYLRRAQGSSEGRRFIRFVTYIAVGGVATGVLALVLALSIVRGFSNEISDKVMGFGAHVQVENLSDAPLAGGRALAATVASVENVDRVSPVVQEFILLRQSSRDVEGVSIWGTDALPEYLEQNLLEGSADFRPAAEGTDPRPPGVVIGRALARNLGVQPGDIVTAFSIPQTGNAGVGLSTPRVRQFRISGVYETSLANFDELYVFTDIDQARSLVGYGTDEVTRLDVTLVDTDDIEAWADRIDRAIEFPAMARSIRDVYRSLFAWVGLQESVIPLVISIIVFVAAVNIIGTLLMVILEKTSEVGILASMGASRRVLRRLFTTFGLYIGIAGVLIGEALAVALTFLQIRFGIIPLPEEAYYMKTAPVDPALSDFLLVAVVTLILCALAAYLPARYAARIEPVRAIHMR
ncbi:MAG: ABC transporter permease [Rhodothermales bacterium]|nr:ABC transporter permease [Rhodothermales bacterium]